MDVFTREDTVESATPGVYAEVNKIISWLPHGKINNY